MSIVKQTHIVVEKVWGSELHIVNTDKYCGKLMTLKKGHISSFHMHPVKDETFYCLSGVILVTLENDHVVLFPGQSLRLLPGEWHSFMGYDDSVFIEFSTTDDPNDSIRQTKSRKVL